MGNAASCAPSITSSGAVKVLFWDGKLQAYTKPMKAAELMLENPGQFLCDSTNLRVGRRIHGLSADEELELKRFYFLLPMELLYSVLTYEEMSALSYKSSKALKHGSNFSNFGKIFPVFSELCISPSDTKTMEISSRGVKEPVERFSKQRSWKPALETIFEC